MFDAIKGLFSPKAALPADFRDRAAKILSTSPEALAAFEASYQKHILNENFDTGNLMDKTRKDFRPDADQPAASAESFDNLKRRIVAELLDQTPYLNYDGQRLTSGSCSELIDKALPGISRDSLAVPVNAQEIMALPENFRPQLSGQLIKRDIGQPSYLILLHNYELSKTARTLNARREAYHMFRQGLDILDLDAITYDMIGTNRNSIGYWFPALCRAVSQHDFLKIPKTRVIKVPMPLLQLSRLDYNLLTQGTFRVLDDFCMHAFCLDENKDYFVKTGVFSSKFDFRNAHVHGPKEVRELGEYLLFIHHQSVLMAGPLSTPSIYGAATTNEWVVREYIPDIENNTTIYKGLPLRTEYRIFIDIDDCEILGVNPYWDLAVMKQRFGHEPDSDSPHQIHDYITYSVNEPRLMARYEANKDRVVNAVKALLSDMKSTGLTGQWSVDIMQNGQDFYVIDMATAATSALIDCVPPEKRKLEKENWIPALPEL